MAALLDADKYMQNVIDTHHGIRHDLFAAIKFEKRPGKNGGAIGLQLSPHFVFKWLVQEAWEHFATNIPNANRDKFLTSEDLFNDPTVWDGYDDETKKGIHIAIGRCLAYFVREKMLPLFCVKPHQSNKLYVVTGQ